VKVRTPTGLFPLLVCLLIVLLSGCGRADNSLAPSPPEALTGVTILHTNDIHGHLDNMPRLASAIDSVRAGADADSLLLLDAGDVFSGSPYATLYHGQASLWFMNHLGYDAVCPGNHEFDQGPDVLAEFVERAGFQVVDANARFPDNEALQENIKPYVVIEKNGEEYGVLGLLTEETSEVVPPGTVAVSDYLEAARGAVAALEGEGIDRIIALTHLGWDEDLRLAGEVGDIDIIVGGHTHTVPAQYPTVINDDGSPTLVVQAGEYTEYLGVLDVKFDGAGVLRDWSGSRLIEIDEAFEPDAAAAARLAEYRAPVEEMMSTVVGSAQVDLDGERADVRSRETNLGDLVADSMLWKAGYDGADVALINGGGIRASIPAGDITLEDVLAVLPFDDYLVAFDLTGAQLTEALENGVSQVEEEQGRFPQVAGMRFTWDPASPPGSRILSVEITKDGAYNPIGASESYRVVTTSYLREGGDGYDLFTAGTGFTNLGFSDYQVLAEYIEAVSPVAPRVEGRISRK
jgi:2',3'-cyclic-nucleotide 2'-phosphodiesterase (5'-nucleotidase family)